MPFHPARVRKLLRSGRASVFLKQTFTIIVHDRVGGETQDTKLRVDSGSWVTGCALVVSGEMGDRCAIALKIWQRSERIKRELDKRRAFRRNRRSRKTRYRKPRFDNRIRPEGWLPPSLRSRVEQVRTWAKRLTRFAQVSGLAVETVRFDPQALQNQEISEVQYQQGIRKKRTVALSVG